VGWGWGIKIGRIFGLSEAGHGGDGLDQAGMEWNGMPMTKGKTVFSSTSDNGEENCRYRLGSLRENSALSPEGTG
jgi:hypothetical protein